MDEGPINGYVLYDDSCGFCRGWIPFWKSTLRKRGFGIAPLQSQWVRDQLLVSDMELIEDLRLLYANGMQLRGADVYRHVLRRIWWAYPIYLIAVMPLGRQAFDWGYRTFARNRFLVSRVCRMRPASNRVNKCLTLHDENEGIACHSDVPRSMHNYRD